MVRFGCELLGFHSGKDEEKVQLQKTMNSAVDYCETGRFPLKIVRPFRIFMFWFKLLQNRNCILYTCYNMFREECDHFKKTLNSRVAN